MKNELIQKVLDDPTSTQEEKAAASLRLNKGRRPSQTSLDDELLSYWKLTGKLRAQAREDLSPSAAAIVEDMADPCLGLIPAQPEAAANRLQKVIDTTASDTVRETVTQALSTLEFLLTTKRVVANG